MSRGELVEQVGRCKRCGRLLIGARSIAAGYGRICASRSGMPWTADAVASRRRILGGPGERHLFPEIDAPLIDEAKQEVERDDESN